MRYLARKGKNMYGKNLMEHSQIDECLDFCLLELNPVITAISGAISKKSLLTKRVYSLYSL